MVKPTIEETAIESHRAQAGLIVLDGIIETDLEDIKEVFYNVDDFS